MLDVFDGLYDFITGISKFITAVFDIITETFDAGLAILSDIPDYLTSLLMYFQILPQEAQVFALMMLHILIVFTVVKIINLVVPFM